MVNDIIIQPEGDAIYTQIKEILLSARRKAYSAVNFAMVDVYWHIGKQIVDAQAGNERAEYGSNLLKYLSEQLARDFYIDECIKSNWSTRQLEKKSLKMK
jgi:hypothetical protein